MGRRCETPERWSTFLSSRAWKASSSTVLADVVRNVEAGVARAVGPRLLPGDGDAVLDRERVVGPDLAADAVLERGDDLASRRVVFRVGREDEHHVERQPDRVAFDLDVALLHDVEEPDLDLSGEVGQFVDGEDAAVGARQKPVVNGELVRDVVAGAGGLDGIEIADHVGDGHVRGGELFDVSLARARARRWASPRPSPRPDCVPSARWGGTGCHAPPIRQCREQLRRAARSAAAGFASWPVPAGRAG